LPKTLVLQSGLENKDSSNVILTKSIAFTLLLLVFYIVEELVVGKFKGETISESFPHIGDGSPRAWLFAIIVISIGLIPFFFV
jgi:hypothetical protein